MKLIIDRIEGTCAVCEQEDRSMLHIPLQQLPHGIKEGDVLLCKDGQYSIDQEATQARREHLDAKRRLLFRN